jgi:hypothetical protein
MDWSGPWWLIVLAFAVALLIVASIYARRSRSTGLGSAAAGLGLKPLLGRNPFSPEERKLFHLFSRGFGATWANFFTDNLDNPSALIFDFRYRFGLRFVASVGHSQTVAAYSARLSNIPDFHLSPATVLDRLAPKLGMQAIHFNSRPDFGKRYWLRGTDEISIHALFHRFSD